MKNKEHLIFFNCFKLLVWDSFWPITFKSVLRPKHGFEPLPLLLLCRQNFSMWEETFPSVVMLFWEGYLGVWIFWHQTPWQSDIWHPDSLTSDTMTVWHLTPWQSDIIHHDSLTSDTMTVWHLTPWQSDLWHHDSLTSDTRQSDIWPISSSGPAPVFLFCPESPRQKSQ